MWLPVGHIAFVLAIEELKSEVVGTLQIKVEYPALRLDLSKEGTINLCKLTRSVQIRGVHHSAATVETTVQHRYNTSIFFKILTIDTP